MFCTDSRSAGAERTYKRASVVGSKGNWERITISKYLHAARSEAAVGCADERLAGVPPVGLSLIEEFHAVDADLHRTLVEPVILRYVKRTGIWPLSA